MREGVYEGGVFGREGLGVGLEEGGGLVDELGQFLLGGTQDSLVQVAHAVLVAVPLDQLPLE